MFGANMSVLSQDIEGEKFPLCNKFTPIMLDGQLCYQLNVSEHTAMKTSSGRKKGLTIILDNNFERSVGVPYTQPKESMDEFDSSLQKQQGVVALSKIYIHTLAGYSGHGPGSHVMTSIKSMTGTHSFLSMSQDKRGGCQLEEREACITHAYLEDRMEQCGCLPLGWAQLCPDKVGRQTNTKLCNKLYVIQRQGLETCSPSGIDCYRSKTAETFNCTTSCVGIYADVEHSIDDGEMKDQVKFDAMAAAYEDGKQNFAENLYFNPDGDSRTFFGKHFIVIKDHIK